MRVLTLSTYDNRSGGAAEAARRLHHGLTAAGHASRMAVQKRFTQDQGIVQAGGPLSVLSPLRFHVDALPLRLGYPHRQKRIWSPAWLPFSPARQAVRNWQPDIVHLHWICHGFMSPAAIADLPVPAVWTLHDMWALSGGCHYADDCRRYEQACGACPQLASGREIDLSRRGWEAKRRAWERASFTVITSSQWLADCALASSLLGGKRIEVIPNAIDATVYAPQDALQWRREFGLPEDRTLVLSPVLSVEHDRNKGFDLLVAALAQLPREVRDSATLVVAGTSAERVPRDLPLAVHPVGRIVGSARMAGLYAACDVVAVPSRLENLALTIMEAMACGRPVVAFASGGNSDMVVHGTSGYLAKPYEPADMAAGLAALLESSDLRQRQGAAARRRVEEEFTAERVTARHVALYEDVLDAASAQRAGEVTS